MNNIEDIIYESLEEITGLGIEDLKQIKDLNLLENGVLDSLSFVNFISYFEKKTNKKCDITKLKITDITSIEKLIETLSRI